MIRKIEAQLEVVILKKTLYKALKACSKVAIASMAWPILGLPKIESESRQQEDRAPAATRLLDQLRDCIRLEHHSMRTEEACEEWARRFVLVNRKRDPRAGASQERS
jgi:hypothetical protein